MKYSSLLIFLLAASCYEYEYTYTVVNESGLTLYFSCSGRQLAPGKTETYHSNYRFESCGVGSGNPKRGLYVRQDPTGTYTFTGYDSAVVYKIAGTATSVDIIEYGFDGPHVHTDVKLPVTFGYKHFTYLFAPKQNVSVTARNKGATGSVKVQIFVRDELFKEASSSEPFATVTASGYYD